MGSAKAAASQCAAPTAGGRIHVCRVCGSLLSAPGGGTAAGRTPCPPRTHWRPGTRAAAQAARRRRARCQAGCPPRCPRPRCGTAPCSEGPAAGGRRPHLQGKARPSEPASGGCSWRRLQHPSAGRVLRAARGLCPEYTSASCRSKLVLPAGCTAASWGSAGALTPTPQEPHPAAGPQ